MCVYIYIYIHVHIYICVCVYTANIQMLKRMNKSGGSLPVADIGVTNINIPKMLQYVLPLLRVQGGNMSKFRIQRSGSIEIRRKRTRTIPSPSNPKKAKLNICTLYYSVYIRHPLNLIAQTVVGHCCSKQHQLCHPSMEQPFRGLSTVVVMQARMLLRGRVDQDENP